MTQTVSAVTALHAGKWKRYPVYKDSGVEWLGEIPEHWEVKRLKYVAPASTAKLLEKPEDLPYLGLESIESKTGRLLLDTPVENVESTVSIFHKGNVLFGKLRPYLAKVVFVHFKGACTTELLVLQPGNQVDGKFLFYRLLSDDFIMLVNSLTYGTKMPRASSEQIGNLAIQLPPLAEQCAIASFLDRETAKVNALIIKKERLIELLQEKRTALISHAVTKGLDPAVTMRDSGVEWLGEIPEHWEVRRLKYLTRDMIAGPFGSSLTKDMYTIEGYRVYGQEQIIPADFSIGDYYIPEDLYLAMKRYAVSAGDVLISCVGTFGKVAVVPPEAEPGIINPRLVKLVPNKEAIMPNCLGLILRSQIAFEQMEQISRGGTMGVINLGLLSNLQLPLLPLPEQQAIVTYLDRETAKIDALISRIREGIEKLKEYSSALIAAAVTGKIDVREVIAQNHLPASEINIQA